MAMSKHCLPKNDKKSWTTGKRVFILTSYQADIYDTSSGDDEENYVYTRREVKIWRREVWQVGLRSFLSKEWRQGVGSKPWIYNIDWQGVVQTLSSLLPPEFYFGYLPLSGSINTTQAGKIVRFQHRGPFDGVCSVIKHSETGLLYSIVLFNCV